MLESLSVKIPLKKKKKETLAYKSGRSPLGDLWDSGGENRGWIYFIALI